VEVIPALVSGRVGPGQIDGVLIDGGCGEISWGVSIARAEDFRWTRFSEGIEGDDAITLRKIPRGDVLVGIGRLIRGNGGDDGPSGCAVVTPLNPETGFVAGGVGPPDVEPQPEAERVEPVIGCDVERRGRNRRDHHARGLIGMVRGTAVL